MEYKYWSRLQVSLSNQGSLTLVFFLTSK